MNLKDLSRVLGPLKTRLTNTVSRAVVKLVDDSLKFQELQVGILNGETRGQVERLQNYGFTAVPLEGAEGVAVCVGGRRDHTVIIACDDRRYRVKGLQGGEVAVYTDEGDKLVFKRGGTVELTATTKVKILCPLVECADLTATGTVNAAVVIDGGITLGTHTHPVSLTGGTTASGCTEGGSTGTTGGSVTSGPPT